MQELIGGLVVSLRVAQRARIQGAGLFQFRRQGDGLFQWRYGVL